ncbi:MAG: transaldolase [Candidatus Moranbacteria bacterium]|nr:transaldolase [Candidatus Moranbacteria bacterium]
MRTKIFLDSGDPQETQKIMKVLERLDGQTTNPSLVAKNPQAKKLTAQGKKMTQEEVMNLYKSIIQEISTIMPNKSISIEVPADTETPAKEMIETAREMNMWTTNAHIKLPITSAGLETAYGLVKEGINVNMTLCFSQEQAAAVHAATQGAKKGQVFVSSFVGGLDDIGLDGVSLLKNINTMFQSVSSHVEVLAASVRDIRRMEEILATEVDIITVPYETLQQYKKRVSTEAVEEETKLETIKYQEIDMEKSWNQYNISHELTTKGLQKFADDWKKMMQ